MSIRDNPPSPRNDQPEELDESSYRVAKAAGSMLRRMQEQPEAESEQEAEFSATVPDVPLSRDEEALMRALQAQQKPSGARPEGPRFLGDRLSALKPDESPFVDLPQELKPQRADGTGNLTLRDIQELDRSHTMPLITPAEARRADEALDHLQSKMMVIANEFAAGQINQAQFQAIYTRYCEQRAIIERIRSRDPQFKAWQAIASEGATGFLRQQFAAFVLGCAVVDNQLGDFIRIFGEFRLEPELLTPIVTSLSDHPVEHREARERSTQIEGGRWLSIAPGEYVTTIVIFSHEPSAAQREMIADLNRDFEKANHRALKNGAANPRLLVYPHRTLFEDQTT